MFVEVGFWFLGGLICWTDDSEKEKRKTQKSKWNGVGIDSFYFPIVLDFVIKKKKGSDYLGYLYWV